MADEKDEYYSLRNSQWDTHLETHLDADPGTWDSIFAVIAPRLGQVSGKRLLDIGCGEGYILQKLRAAGCNAHGLDFSPRLADIARQLNPGAGIYCQSFLDPFPGGPYDLVISYSVLQYCCPSDMSKLLKNCHDALAPGGISLHFAIPDVERMHLADKVYFSCPDEENFVRMRTQMMTRFARDQSPFPDGSFFHSFPAIARQADEAGFSRCQKLPCSYRSHLMLEKGHS